MTRIKIKTWTKRILWILVILVAVMNAVAFLHSYKFTHYSDSSLAKTASPGKLSTTGKMATLIFGVNNPRPENNNTPIVPYQTIRLKSNEEIECWSIRSENPVGTVVLFHGYGGQKSSLLDKAYIFREFGYNTLLVDFMGSGGSQGIRTTIGYWEAEQVKACYDYLARNGEKNVYLFGTSMGAVAIMKSIADSKINPSGIIIECPFGSMYQTVCARFRTMNAPVFPMAGLLVFWGGVQNKFWAFGHNPISYAGEISCPTLLMYGSKDEKVSKGEIDDIFSNLGGPKELKIYPDAGHENYLTRYRDEWTSDIKTFMGVKN